MMVLVFMVMSFQRQVSVCVSSTVRKVCAACLLRYCHVSAICTGTGPVRSYLVLVAVSVAALVSALASLLASAFFSAFSAFSDFSDFLCLA